MLTWNPFNQQSINIMRNQTFNTMGTVVSISYRSDLSLPEASYHTGKISEIFTSYDEEFSTYKPESMVSRINAAAAEPIEFSDAAFEVFNLAEKFRLTTEGYFDIITPEGKTDPSGVVKAYALQKAGEYLTKNAVEDWCINAGGDILANSQGAPWIAGISNPSKKDELLSTVSLSFPMKSLATSGFSERGMHIWTPVGTEHSDIVQASVISDDIIFADVMATALIARGSQGLSWVEEYPTAEALLVQRDGSYLVTAGYLDLVA